MYDGNTVAVVVPAYNEEGFVGSVIESVPDYTDRIYVIDDASTDGTWAEIEETARQVNERYREDDTVRDRPPYTDRTDPTSSPQNAVKAEPQTVHTEQCVVPIQHRQNRGVGGAIKTGYKRAMEDEIDVTAVMAGDNQMDPSALPDLLDPITSGRADYSKGNRLLYPDHRKSMSSWRLFGNALLSFLTKIASGYWKTMDPQNGYTAISRRGLEAVDIDDIYEDYGFANSLLVRLNVHNMRVADVAIPAVYGDETSHIKYRTFIPLLSKVLLSSFLWRLQRKYLLVDFHPLALLYFQGAIVTGIGILLFGITLVNVLMANTAAMTAVASILMLSLGTFALIQAMIYDMQENEDLEVRVT